MPDHSASSNAAPRAPGSFNPQTSSASSIAASSYAFQRSRNASLDSNDPSSQTPTANNGFQRSRHVSPERQASNLRSDPYLTSEQWQRFNASASNLSNYNQRPSASYLSLTSHSRGTSPSRLQSKNSTGDFRIHQRKHANSQGFFEPSLPNTSHADFSNMESPQPQQGLTASQIAAQAAIQSHQRKRSQTVPEPVMSMGQRKPSRGGPISPPLLSVTEASGERRDGFGQQGSFSATTGQSQNGQIYRNGLLAGSVNPAATAANVVFARSPQPSPTTEFPPVKEDKSAKEKIKGKLFSRPRGPSKDKEKAPGSPSKLNIYGQQRAMASNASLVDPTLSSASSMYSLANSSQATIRASDQGAPYSGPEKEHKEKKHHHFLSRQKEKLSGKGDHHLPLSSANSNSRPVDPSAPSSFYNFNLPPSPGPATTSFSKSMRGLDLRHGGRALREKKKEEKRERNESFEMSNLREFESSADFNGPSSLGSTSGKAMYPGKSPSPYPTSIYGSEANDMTRFGLANMTPDDAWPLLKTRTLIIFQGEDARMTIENMNCLVVMHLQRCIAKRSAQTILDDFRDVITTGMKGIDAILRRQPEDGLIPHLVEMWLFVFASILPHLQAIFLPLDQEFAGTGPLLSPEQAREFWGALPVSSLSNGSNKRTTVPARLVLSVRRMILTAYRDIVFLPRYEILDAVFSRLSLESINAPSQSAFSFSNSPIHPFTLSSSPSDRPSTALSLDPAFSSYGSQGTTLLNGGGSGSGSGGGSVGARSRGVSNVSFGSDQREAVYAQSRPSLTLPTVSQLHREHSAAQAAAQQREANDSGSRNVTEVVARMLQCICVLASVGIIPGDGSEVRAQREERARVIREGTGRSRSFSTGMVEDEQAQEKIESLGRKLKLNWLGRGRTGRNRRGFVGARGAPTMGPIPSSPAASSLNSGRMGGGLPSVG